MSERGEIHNREAARQLRDFSGLRWDKITPSDIDLAIDFQNRIFIFAELKWRNAEMPFGQRLLLERITDGLTSQNKDSICFVASHSEEGYGDIDTANCIVNEYRYKFEWCKTNSGITLKKAINGFRVKHIRKGAFDG